MLAKAEFSTSTYPKSASLKTYRVSSLVVIVLLTATGGSFTAVTSMVMVERATLYNPPSFTSNSKVAYAAPLAFAEGRYLSRASCAVGISALMVIADSPPLTLPLSSKSNQSVPAVTG